MYHDVTNIRGYTPENPILNGILRLPDSDCNLGESLIVQRKEGQETYYVDPFLNKDELSVEKFAFRETHHAGCTRTELSIFLAAMQIVRDVEDPTDALKKVGKTKHWAKDTLTGVVQKTDALTAEEKDIVRALIAGKTKRDLLADGIQINEVEFVLETILRELMFCISSEGDADPLATYIETFSEGEIFLVDNRKKVAGEIGLSLKQLDGILSQVITTSPLSEEEKDLLLSIIFSKVAPTDGLFRPIKRLIANFCDAWQEDIINVAKKLEDQFSLAALCKLVFEYRLPASDLHHAARQLGKELTEIGID